MEVLSELEFHPNLALYTNTFITSRVWRQKTLYVTYFCRSMFIQLILKFHMGNISLQG